MMPDRQNILDKFRAWAEAHPPEDFGRCAAFEAGHALAKHSAGAKIGKLEAEIVFLRTGKKTGLFD